MVRLQHLRCAGHAAADHDHADPALCGTAVEFTVLALSAVAVSALVFTRTGSVAGFSLWVGLVVPLLGWLGLRFGVAPTALVAPVVVGIAAYSGAHSLGPFQGTEPDLALLIPMDVFLIFVCMTA